MTKFTHEPAADAPVTKIQVEVASGATLPQMLEAFRSFLLAAGYEFTGELEIVDLDEYVYGHDLISEDERSEYI